MTKPTVKRVASLTLIPALLFLIAQFFCLPQGVALSPARRALNGLKNRDARPLGADFDGRVTLAALLEPGADGGRWSASRAAAIEGHVVAVREGGVESTNCFSLI